jgi:hypothetical protein
MVGGLLFCGLSSAAAPDHPGKAIYRQLCADCHGDDGQGVDGKYDEPLIGDRRLEALARKIEKTMPEEKPELCVGEDAKQVAAYIYDAFYSAAAQARREKPSKDLLRLTIPQFRNSVTDLLGRFHMGAGFDRPIGSEQGLKALYRGVAVPKPGEKVEDTTPKRGIKMKRPNHKIERVEPGVAFHWGADSPDKATMEAEQFHNEWDGCVIAEETGVYEFALKTENGARLWVNNDDEDDPLIDAWVSAGPQVREESKTIFLLGGRAYRLRLQHFKFKEQSASIELWWKPPHGVKEIIPAHVLRTERPRHMMIVSTSFPADDRSVGYERGSTISKEWEQAVTEAAIETSEYVEGNIDRLAATKEGAPDRVEKWKQFAVEFVSAAFGRPVTAEQKSMFVDAQFSGAKTPEMAVKRVVLLALKSPRFLYPALRETQPVDDHAIASRLALTLWDSLPDRQLAKAAADGKLRTPKQIREQAVRMIASDRTKAKLHGFFHHWLELERAENLAKDPKAFPGFDSVVMADLRESLMRFIDSVVWNPASDYRELLKADYLLLNERLAKIYGQSVQGGEFRRVSYDPKQRAGVVTHPYLLASLAYSKQSSPIHRGVFLTRNVVGMSLKSPPMAVAFEDSHFDPGLTMREKVTHLTRSNNCMSCHSMINPLGFSLENFDAIGRWRTKDNNKPVNPVSDFMTEEGKTIRLTGPRDIVNYVADNPAGHRAFIRHLFNHLVNQQIPAYGPQVMADLQQRFAASGCNIQKLLVEIAIVSAMDGLTAVSKTAATAQTPAPPSS